MIRQPVLTVAVLGFMALLLTQSHAFGDESPDRPPSVSDCWFIPFVDIRLGPDSGSRVIPPGKTRIRARIRTRFKQGCDDCVLRVVETYNLTVDRDVWMFAMDGPLDSSVFIDVDVPSDAISGLVVTFQGCGQDATAPLTFVPEADLPFVDEAHLRFVPKDSVLWCWWDNWRVLLGDPLLGCRTRSRQLQDGFQYEIALDSGPALYGPVSMQVHFWNSIYACPGELDLCLSENILSLGRTHQRFALLPEGSQSYTVCVEIPPQDTSCVALRIEHCGWIAFERFYFVTTGDTLGIWSKDPTEGHLKPRRHEDCQEALGYRFCPDPYPPDTVKLEFHRIEASESGRCQARVDLMLSIQGNPMTYASQYFTWNNAGVELDSAVEALFVDSLRICPVFLAPRGNIDLANLTHTFCFEGGFDLPSNPAWARQHRLWASYYFSWDSNSTDGMCVADTLSHDSRPYARNYLTMNRRASYLPVWGGPVMWQLDRDSTGVIE